MTKKLADLFTSFSAMSNQEQLDKIRQVRDTRSIERPAVAKRRQKKQIDRTEKQIDKTKGLLAALSEEEKAELKLRLGGGWWVYLVIRLPELVWK